MNVTLVYSEKSGGALSAKELRSRFNAAGVLITRLVRADDSLEKRLQAPIKNAEHIAVIGGDGTISRVAGLLAGTSAVLLPFSGGTFNNFTKDLGIAQDLDVALAKIKQSRIRAIDVARINDIVFVNNSSIGVYPQSLYQRELYEPKYGKWAAMAIGVIKTLMTFKVLQVEVDGKRYQTPFIFIGNNKYTLSANAFSRRTQLTEGVLTVAIAKTSTRLGLMKIALLALLGKTHELKEVKLLYPERVSVTFRGGPTSIAHDGEYSIVSSPLEYKIEKKSLKILG